MLRVSSPLPTTSTMVPTTGSSVTSLVRLDQGNFDRTAFGVYIGGKVVMGQVLFEESKWHNPWENAVGFSKEQSLLRYRSKIMHNPHLLNELTELAGKTLGHFFEGSAEENSHGSVLINLIKMKVAGQCHVPASLLCERTQGQHIFFEPYSCWDNATASVMKFNRHHFLTTDQLHTYLMFVDSGQYDLAQTLTRVTDLGFLGEAMDTLPILTEKLMWDQKLAVFNMVRVLDFKYRHDTHFQTMCLLRARDPDVSYVSNRPRHIFVDCSKGSRNQFWGCGKTVAEICDDQSLLELPGLNVMGWCLTFVNNYHQLCEALPSNSPAPYSPFVETLHRLEQDLKTVEEETKHTRALLFLDPMYKGLSSLLTCLRHYQEEFKSGKAWLDPHAVYCVYPAPTPPPPTVPQLAPADSTSNTTHNLSLDHHVQIVSSEEEEEAAELAQEEPEEPKAADGSKENQTPSAQEEDFSMVDEDTINQVSTGICGLFCYICNKNVSSVWLLCCRKENTHTQLYYYYTFHS